jgi:hypothetical protein
MATPVKKLTPNILKKMIMEEAKKLQNETLEMGASHPSKVKPNEIDADEYADTLAHPIEYIKALKLQEQRLLRKLKQIREAKKKIGSKFIDSL